MGEIEWVASEDRGRLESLSVLGGPPLIEFAAHEYSQRGNPLKYRVPNRPVGRFTNLHNASHTKEDEWDVFSGLLYNNVTGVPGTAMFTNKFLVEDDSLRMIATRYWKDRDNVYDDSIYFIHNHLNYHSMGCKICRRLSHGDGNCKDCFLYKPWWFAVGVLCPDDIYYKWYTSTKDNTFISKDPVIREYSKGKSHKEIGVFCKGSKGSSSEIRGPRHSLKIEVVDTSCENAQLRVVTVKTHTYLETEYQFDWPGQRMRGDTNMVEIKITPFMK